MFRTLFNRAGACTDNVYNLDTILKCRIMEQDILISNLIDFEACGC